MEQFKKYGMLTVETIVAILLILWCLDAFGVRSPMFAFLLNWIAMSWVAFTGQSIHFSLPSSYYEIKPFEHNGESYVRLGILVFKNLVRRGPLAMFSPTLRFPKVKTTFALQQLDAEMRKAEAGHVIIFMMVLVVAIYALLQGWLDAVGWMLAFNIVINGYPIMLQRYNRIKLQQLIHSHAF